MTFSYINVWVKFDPNFSYLISYLNFLYIFDDVITNFWHPFWNASRHPYTKILVWACSLDSLDAFWYPRLVIWTTESDIMEFAQILPEGSSSHIYPWIYPGYIHYVLGEGRGGGNEIYGSMKLINYFLFFFLINFFSYLTFLYKSQLQPRVWGWRAKCYH